jgi:hypothetical protein
MASYRPSTSVPRPSRVPTCVALSRGSRAGPYPRHPPATPPPPRRVALLIPCGFKTRWASPIKGHRPLPRARPRLAIPELCRWHHFHRLSRAPPSAPSRGYATNPAPPLGPTELPRARCRLAGIQATTPATAHHHRWPFCPNSGHQRPRGELLVASHSSLGRLRRRPRRIPASPPPPLGRGSNCINFVLSRVWTVI